MLYFLVFLGRKASRSYRRLLL